MTFDPSKKKLKPKVPKQEKKPKDQNETLYNVTKYNKLIIYESKEDAYNVLNELRLTSTKPQTQTSRLMQTYTWPKYKNTPMEEVNKLWSFERPAQDNQKEDLSHYTYKEMLTYIFKDQKQQQQTQKQLEIPALEIERPRPKHFVVKNFKDVCSAMNRGETQVCDYLKKQLKASSCHVQEGQLIFQATTTNDKLRGYLQDYAQQYIKCPSCGNYDTIVIQHENGRDQLLQCESCNSQRHITKHSDD